MHIHLPTIVFLNAPLIKIHQQPVARCVDVMFWYDPVKRTRVLIDDTISLKQSMDYLKLRFCPFVMCLSNIPLSDASFKINVTCKVDNCLMSTIYQNRMCLPLAAAGRSKRHGSSFQAITGSEGTRSSERGVKLTAYRML